MALKSSNKVDTNVYEIEVTVAPEEFTQACKDAYLKRRKSIQLPGFRKGKATQGMTLTVPHEAGVACSTAKALEWDAAWKNMDEPSGRAIAGVHDKAY